MMKPIERLKQDVYPKDSVPERSDRRDILLRLRDPQHMDEACLEDQFAMEDAADEIERLRNMMNDPTNDV